MLFVIKAIDKFEAMLFVRVAVLRDQLTVGKCEFWNFGFRFMFLLIIYDVQNFKIINLIAQI